MLHSTVDCSSGLAPVFTIDKHLFWSSIRAEAEKIRFSILTFFLFNDSTVPRKADAQRRGANRSWQSRLWLSLLISHRWKPDAASSSTGSSASSLSGSLGLQDKYTRAFNEEIKRWLDTDICKFSSPPNLRECSRLFPIMICRLGAAMKPSCCRLRFFTSLSSRMTKEEMAKGKYLMNELQVCQLKVYANIRPDEATFTAQYSLLFK